MSDHLYPTLIADSSLTTPAADNYNTLQKQMTSEIDKYLQEVAEECERDDNYFDGGTCLPIYQVCNKKIAF